MEQQNREEKPTRLLEDNLHAQLEQKFGKLSMNHVSFSQARE